MALCVCKSALSHRLHLWHAVCSMAGTQHQHVGPSTACHTTLSIAAGHAALSRCTLLHQLGMPAVDSMSDV